jgi:hypothetical protein
VRVSSGQLEAPIDYFVTMRIEGGGGTAAGEIAKVSHRFQLLGADRKYVTDLWPDPDHSRPEASDMIARAAIAANFLVDIADRADKNLLAQELRRAPIEVHIDAVRIIGRVIFDIRGEAEHRRKFVPGRLVEIGVPNAGIDRAVPDPDIRQACRLVGPDRDVSGPIYRPAPWFQRSETIGIKSPMPHVVSVMKSERMIGIPAIVPLIVADKVVGFRP